MTSWSIPMPHAPKHTPSLWGSLWSLPFILLLTTFVGNTLLWAVIVQPGHPPDEWLHFDYVRHLYLHHTLPVYGETRYIFNPDLLQAHAMLPPLYYLLGTPMLAITQHQPVEVQIVAVRFVSIVIATGTVTIAFLLGRMLTPTRPTFGLALAALVGFNPMFTYMSAAVNSDNLVNCIAAALLLVLVYGLQQSQRQTPWLPSRRWMVGMGGLIGAGLLTKPTIAVAVLACGMMLIWMAWQSPPPLTQRLRLLLVMAAWIGGVAMLISGWSFVRNWLLYGDAVGVSLVGSQTGSYIPHPYHQIGTFSDMLMGTQTFNPLLPTLFHSFWGYFDHLQLLMPPRLMLLVTIMSVGGGIGTLVWLIRHWQQRHGEHWQPTTAIAMAGAWFIVLTLGAVLYACYRVDYQPQGRYLYSTLLPLMLVILVGWEQLAARLKLRFVVVPMLLATMVVVNIAALTTTIAPGHHYRAVRGQAGQGVHPVPLAHKQSTEPPQIAFGPFAAQYVFVPRTPHVAQITLLLDMSPGVYGPIIWRIADNHQQEVAHAVAEQVPRKLAAYTLALPPDLALEPGKPYTLLVTAPWANGDKPLRAYPSTSSPPNRLLALHIGYADEPLAQGLDTLSRHLLTDTLHAKWGKIQLALYGVVAMLMVALVGRALLWLPSVGWRSIAGGGGVVGSVADGIYAPAGIAP